MDTQKNDKLSKLDKINLVFGVVAVLLLSASLALGQFGMTLKTPDWLRPALYYTGLGAMAIYGLTLAWLKRVELKQFASHKHTKSGANVGLQITAVLAILVAANWYGARHHARFDLTENKQYSLSDQTQKILRGLKEPVTVKVFLKTGDPMSENLKTLWKDYAYIAGDKLKLELIDPDKDPMLARQNDVKAFNTSILERGGRKQTITGTQEQDLTSALLKVTKDGQKVIYFVGGHGELEIDKFDQQGLSSAKDALEKQNYKLDKLSLLAKKAVPTDAALVAIVGPSKPFLDSELKALEAYLAGGGRVFLALQPQRDAKLDALAKAYGITVNNDLVLDPQVNTGDIAAPAVQRFPSHTITNGLQTAFFPGSRSLSKAAAAPAGVTVTPLVETGEGAWGETNFMERNVGFDPGKDHKGPLPIMLLAEKGKSRLVVAGNALFASNIAYNSFNNGDLFLNTLNYMADEENLVSIPPKDNAPKTVNLLPEQSTAVFYGTALGLPLVLLLIGGFVWWRRR